MSAPETLRDDLMDTINGMGCLDGPPQAELRARFDAIIAAARAESDALRAALEEGRRRVADLRDCNKDDDCHVMAKGAALVIEDIEYALAPSPAEPAAPERCAFVIESEDGPYLCGATLTEGMHEAGNPSHHDFQPAAPDPAAPDRCAFQRDGLEPCLLDRDNPRHTGCAHNPPRFLHGQQMACHDFRPAAPEREP